MTDNDGTPQKLGGLTGALRTAHETAHANIRALAWITKVEAAGADPTKTVGPKSPKTRRR